MPELVLRQIFLEVRINGTLVDDILWGRVRISFAEPVASAQFMTPVNKVSPEAYNQAVDIAMGTSPGSSAYVRFRGYLRNRSADLFPAAITHNCVGRLQKAAEYFNGENTPGMGGMPIPQLFERGISAPNNMPPWHVSDWFATGGAVVDRVLQVCGVPHDSGRIGDSGIQYGFPPAEFIWSAGTPTTGSPLGLHFPDPLAAQSAGESGLAYIQRYDQIDAQWNGDNQGGFYRTSEGLGGDVFRVLIGGRPGGSMYTFTEDVNVLDGRIERQYPTGNRMIVTGHDWGGRTGPMRYSANRNNPFMGQGEPHYAPNPPSSSMIIWATRGMSEEANVALLGGQNCEVVAQAALLEANKLTPTGQLTTPDDHPIQQGNTVRLQGPGGGSGRLTPLGAEDYWVQGVTIDCGHGPNGAPIFTQTIDVQGGGVD